MDIFKLIIAKYLLGYILQDLLFVVGIYTFNKQPIDKKNFTLINLMFIPTTIIVRFLPISFGIHTLLNVTMIFVITYFFFKFDLYPTVKSTLLCTVLLLLTEIVGIFSMLALFGQDQMNIIMADDYIKALTTIPMNFLFGIIITIQYFRMIKAKK